MTRRAAGEGTVFKLPSGSWRAKITVDGKQYVKNAKTKSEAIKELDKLKSRAKKEKILVSEKVTVNEIFERLQEKKMRSRKKVYALSSLQRTESIYKTHVKDRIGSRDITKVTDKEINRILDDAYNSDLGYTTLSKIYSCIKQIFDLAVRQKYILKHDNPMMVVEPFSAAVFDDNGRNDEIVYLTEKEREKLKQAALTRCKNGNLKYRYGTVFVLMLQTGMRAGEVCALTWESVDFEKGLIAVNSTVTYVRDDQKKWVAKIQKNPKTDRSRRHIPINQTAREMLELMKEIYGDKKYVVVSSTGSILPPSRLGLAFETVLKAAGITDKKGTHILRHTFATALITGGTPLPVISSLLGHAGTAVTERHYARIIDQVKAQALENIGEI